MGRGKIGAQCGHATLLTTDKALKRNPQMFRAWRESCGEDAQLYETHSEEQLENLRDTARAHKIFSSIVYDAGRTQIEAGSGLTILFCLFFYN